VTAAPTRTAPATMEIVDTVAIQVLASHSPLSESFNLSQIGPHPPTWMQPNVKLAAKGDHFLHHVVTGPT
jgi:hypothetical protein